MRVLALLFFLMNAAFAQKTTEYIAWSHGGGFANFYTSYRINLAGQVFEKIGLDGRFEQIQTLDSATTKWVFNEAKTMGLDTLECRKSGNMTRTLEFSTSGKKNIIVWPVGSNDDFLLTLNKYYLFLSQLVKKQ